MSATKIRQQCFDALVFLLFNRKRSLIFCIAYVVLSLMAELHLKWQGFFSCAGAIVTIAGLFLNIKYSLNFHLKITKLGLYNKLSGAGMFGTSEITPEQEAYVDSVLADEMYGVAFMLFGTLLWAYGSYIIPLLTKA